MLLEHFFLIAKEYNNERLKVKKDYQPYFQKHYGVSDYAGHLSQVEEMVDSLTKKDFDNFVDNISRISETDRDLPSSNFLDFINYIKR